MLDLQYLSTLKLKKGKKQRKLVTMHKEDDEEVQRKWRRWRWREKHIELEADSENDGSIKENWLMVITTIDFFLKPWKICVVDFLSKYIFMYKLIYLYVYVNTCWDLCVMFLLPKQWYLSLDIYCYLFNIYACI